MNKRIDYFTSRWGFIFAALGMAIGAGNIWRFPRLAGQYGGSFLIPWVLFLFLWSVPLIIIEFSIGKNLRLGVLRSFTRSLGKNYSWMGWFIVICTTSIMFYYSVVCGWSLKYLTLSVTDSLNNLNHTIFWERFTSGNIESILFYLIALALGCVILLGGIANGIERATKIMIPLLFLLLIIAAIRALTLPSAYQGLQYFFRVNTLDLFNYKVWLEALSQSAWSTGAGWGLILTYASYVKKKEGIIINSLLTGLGNNMASIIVGLAVIPTVFALSPSIDSAKQALEAGNQGLTFIYIPRLFSNLPAGNIFASLFFLSLFIAALSSLLSMLELAVRFLIDYGINRKNAVIIVGMIAAIAGLPSALSLKIFNNQDWVWGIGLLLSGFFFIIFVLRLGFKKFIFEYLEFRQNDGIYLSSLLKYFIIFMMFEFIILLFWWFFQSWSWYPDSWWNPFGEYTVGTCILQWFFVIGIGFLVSNKLFQSRQGL